MLSYNNLPVFPRNEPNSHGERLKQSIPNSLGKELFRPDFHTPTNLKMTQKTVQSTQITTIYNKNGVKDKLT